MTPPSPTIRRRWNSPQSVVAYRYRTYLYYKLGRGGAARDDFNRILELETCSMR